MIELRYRRLLVCGVTSLLVCGAGGSSAASADAGTAVNILTRPVNTTMNETAAAAAATITIDTSRPDRDVAHQVIYRRGVVEKFDLGRSPSKIVQTTIDDVHAMAGNFLNATLDIRSSQDAGLFTYPAQNLAPSPSGDVPLERTFHTLRDNLAPQALSTMVQVSGTPAAYQSKLDPRYEVVCGAKGNFFSLPIPGAPMRETQNAVERWIGALNGSVPGAIWIGTQEPSHTLGYSTVYNAGGCAKVPGAAKSAATENNINRYIEYWTPIARYLKANHILSGGIQLNATNEGSYAWAAERMMSAQMPLDYFTVQVYKPSLKVDRALYDAYRKFQQNPNYRSVKVIIDRYGFAHAGEISRTAKGVIEFLQDEAQLMPYADMLYGYDVEASVVKDGGAATLLPQVLTWLQSAPAPLRPLTSTTSDLQAFALVEKDSGRRAYIALWNASPASVAHTVSIVLNGFSSAISASNLTILKGSGKTISRLSNSGIVVRGNEISGLTLNPDEFVLISLSS